ncbi:hypothetical protein NMY22_g847 [Coprinellus aureogranulatus]|nr:hypothetical protein NMY22_g847 [Coprinellus aureogranulatus]
MDSPHIDRIVFGRHYRRQSVEPTGTTTTRGGRKSFAEQYSNAIANRCGWLLQLELSWWTVGGLPDILFPQRPTTTTTSAASPTTSSAETTTSTSSVEEKPTETTTSTSSATSQTSTIPTETSTSIDPIPTQQQTTAPPPTTSTEVVIESQTVTNSAVPKTTTSLGAGNVGAASKNAFLENKVASGVTFGICGLVGFLLILGIIWLAMRRRLRIRKLEKEIISFDPEDVSGYHQTRRGSDGGSVNSLEKGGSSLDHHAGSGYLLTLQANQDGRYRDAPPFSDIAVHRQPTLQRPGNAAFNQHSGAPGMYAAPPQTYNHLS